MGRIQDLRTLVVWILKPLCWTGGGPKIGVASVRVAAVDQNVAYLWEVDIWVIMHATSRDGQGMARNGVKP